MATREVGCDEAGGPPWERPAASPVIVVHLINKEAVRPKPRPVLGRGVGRFTKACATKAPSQEGAESSDVI